MSESYVCPACGFPDLTEPPRTPGAGGSYEICWSCGFEFGVTDDDLGYTYNAWRQAWIKRGMPWDSSQLRPPPSGWDPEEQVRCLLGASE